MFPNCTKFDGLNYKKQTIYLLFTFCFHREKCMLRLTYNTYQIYLFRWWWKQLECTNFNGFNYKKQTIYLFTFCSAYVYHSILHILKVWSQLFPGFSQMLRFLFQQKAHVNNTDLAYITIQLSMKEMHWNQWKGTKSWCTKYCDTKFYRPEEYYQQYLGKGSSGANQSKLICFLSKSE